MSLSLLAILISCSTAPPPLTADEVRTALQPSCEQDPDVTVYGSHWESLVRIDRDLAAPDLAVSLDVTKDEWILDGMAIGTEPRALMDDLREKRATAEDLAGRVDDPSFAFDGELLLQVHADVPASTLMQIFETAHRAGFPHPRMVVRLRPNPPPDFVDPEFAAALRAELDAILHAERQVRVGEQTALQKEQEATLERCPAALAALQAAGAASYEAKCEVMAAGLTQALPGCSRSDGEKIVTGIQVMMMGGPWRLGVVPLHLDPAGTVVRVDPGATWGELAPRWVELSGPMWFQPAIP